MARRSLSGWLVVLVLGLTAEPARGQSPSEPGPIVRAAAREAVRIGRTLAAGDGPTDEAGRHAPDADAEWRRVGGLRRGAEITLTVKDSPARLVYLVAVDQSGVTVLDHDLPAAVEPTLWTAAQDHPEQLVMALHGNRVSLDSHVQVGPEGVFARGVKVVDLEAILVRIARGDVVEIRTRRLSARIGTGWGALAGFGVGLLVGSNARNAACRTMSCDEAYRAEAKPFYAAVGAGIGSGLGAAAGAASRAQTVIYLAP